MASITTKSILDITGLSSATNEITLVVDSLTSNTGLNITSASTGAASNTQTLVSLGLSGANGTSTQTTTGLSVSNTHTGTSSTNVGLNVVASGGTNNYGLLVTGDVGIRTTTPTQALDIVGNLQLGVTGNKILIKTGSNASAGTATLIGGTVTVSNTTVTANTLIFLTRQSTGGTIGEVYISARTAATSFTISSDNPLDTSIIAWFFIEPAP